MQGHIDSGRWLRSAAAVTMVAGMLACGDSDNGNPAGPSGGGGGATSGATITIGANGAVSPAQVTVNVGQTVTFVNSHTSSHQIASDPHPAHTNCPPVNTLQTLTAGQTRATGAFTAAGTCGFHDHNDPSNTSLQGTITIR
jgi:plastocyanin